MKRIFVFAYYSVKDPVFISATLNYLEQLNQKNPTYHFHLLTFEHDGFTISDQERKALSYSLQKSGITWYESRWHTGGVLKPLLKIYDLMVSLFLGVRIVVKNNCELVYSEGSVGSCISIFIACLTRRPHVVHSFEPHADSMLEGGVWGRKSWEYLLLKKLEKLVARWSSALITSTDAYQEVIDQWGFMTRVFVIPSCVDTDKFFFSEDERRVLREKNNVHSQEAVIVYLGKFGGMYMEDELFQFFANCEFKSKVDFKYWVLTIDEERIVKNSFKRFGIPTEKVLVKRAESDEVYKYLSAADCGVVAVRPLPAKRFCSPIKTGEYWACGLPIIVPEGVGDDYIIVQKDAELGLSVKSIEEFVLEWVPDRVGSKGKMELRALKHYVIKLDKILKDKI